MSNLTITQPERVSADLTPIESDWRDYFALLKPRVMSLVVFSGLTGMLLAPGEIHIVTAVIALVSIALGAGASGAINMWYDSDIDSIMERTRNRPIPRGRVAPEEALTLGVVVGGASVLIMGLMVGVLAALLLCLTIGFYVFVYTVWLKRRTHQNIVIGGAAGALPPVIGWAAVTGQVGVLPLVLFAIIFFWTPPHFWALSLYRCEDYRLAGVPMLPVVRGSVKTRQYIMLYSLILISISLAPWLLGELGIFYGVTAILLGLLFVGKAFTLLRYGAAEEVSGTHRSAKKLFGYSILYLFLLLVTMPIANWLTSESSLKFLGI